MARYSGHLVNKMPKRLNIKDCQTVAERFNGKCLSEIYLNNQQKLRWECEHGHQFEKDLISVKNHNVWCSECNKNSILEKCRNLAYEKGGECLSEKFEYYSKPLRFKCKDGHIFERVPNSLYNGTWCLKCSGREAITLDDCILLAKTHNGECLSTEYIDTHTLMEWKCSEGHIWKSTHCHINKGCWCPKCHHIKLSKIQRLDVSEYHKLAEEFNGKYTDINQTPIVGESVEWECENGHRFFSRYNNIKSNKTWCPKCAHPKVKENICRDIFQKLLGKEFLTVRPKWLKNPKTGGTLELDGYCEELKLAFEYDGEFHYKNIYTETALQDQRYRDMIKEEICKIQGIVLIRIPYFQADFEGYIINKLKEFGYENQLLSI